MPFVILLLTEHNEDNLSQTVPWNLRNCQPIYWVTSINVLILSLYIRIYSVLRAAVHTWFCWCCSLIATIHVFQLYAKPEFSIFLSYGVISLIYLFASLYLRHELSPFISDTPRPKEHQSILNPSDGRAKWGQSQSESRNFCKYLFKMYCLQHCIPNL